MKKKRLGATFFLFSNDAASTAALAAVRAVFFAVAVALLLLSFIYPPVSSVLDEAEHEQDQAGGCEF